MTETQNLEAFVQQVRRDILRQVHAVNSGHPGGSLGCAEFFSVLFKEVMQYDPNFKPDGENEDIFFLSNGHISPVYYSVLARCGFFDVSELKTFRKINSRLQGHPTTHEGLPGIRIASGSLGQGMSVSIGAAQTKELNDDEHLVYSLHGDGELQEGQNWEAIMYAGSKGIDNLIATIDHNGQQIDGATKDVMPLNNIRDKFTAFDWQVVEVDDGNDLDQVRSGLRNARQLTGKGKPTVMILNTVMGNGVDYMMHTHEWHGKAPDDELLEKGLAQNPETLGDY